MYTNNLDSVDAYWGVWEILDGPECSEEYLATLEDWEKDELAREHEEWRIKTSTDNYLPTELYRSLRKGKIEVTEENLEKAVQFLQKFPPEVFLLSVGVNFYTVQGYLYGCDSLKIYVDESKLGTTLWVHQSGNRMTNKELFEDIVSWSGEICALYDMYYKSLSKEKKKALIELMKKEDYNETYPLMTLIVRMNNKKGMFEA